MSGLIKFLFLLVLIGFIGVVIFIQAALLGDPKSNFNQTTRFTLAKYSIFRTIFRLHNAGDARGQYFLRSGPIAISWLKPYSQNVDRPMLETFAAEITKQTGRKVNISFGGNLKEGNYEIADLKSEKLEALIQKPEGSSLVVFFVQDYTPREADELSTTYGESGILISLDSHQKHMQSYGGTIESYLLSSLLHEFGHQLGLEHNENSNCIMNARAGTGYSYLSSFGKSAPETFCPFEEKQIREIKLKLEN